MTDAQYAACHTIIHSFAAACTAAGAGMAQLPCSDAVPISTAQIAMVIALGEVFGIPLSESAAKSLIAGISGAAVGRMVSQILIGWIPGLGNTINGITAAAITEALGWKVARQFAASTASAA